jgi:hypothetical protein
VTRRIKISNRKPPRDEKEYLREKLKETQIELGSCQRRITFLESDNNSKDRLLQEFTASDGRSPARVRFDQETINGMLRHAHRPEFVVHVTRARENDVTMSVEMNIFTEGGNLLFHAVTNEINCGVPNDVRVDFTIDLNR